MPSQSDAIQSIINEKTIPKNLRTKGHVPRELNRFVPAYSDHTDYTDLYRLQDKPFATKEDLKRFHKLFIYGGLTLSQRIRDLEYRWGEVYFNPLTEFMGDIDLWEALGIHVSKTPLWRLPVTPYPVAYYTGSHWVSRRAGTAVVFDPYDEFQIYGTNQFCQTYAMMHVLPSSIMKSPVMRKNTTSSGHWRKYYTYTKSALEFIKKLIEFCKKHSNIRSLETFSSKYPNTTFKNLDAAIDTCLAHPYMCLNIINLGESGLTR